MFYGIQYQYQKNWYFKFDPSRYVSSDPCVRLSLVLWWGCWYNSWFNPWVSQPPHSLFMADSPAGLSSQAIHGVHWVRLPCALAWLSVVCHSGVVSLTGNSKNCHLWIFSDRQKFFIEIPWKYFFYNLNAIGIVRFLHVHRIVFLLIARRIQFSPLFPPFHIPFPSSPSLFPFPSPFFLLPVYQHHCYYFTSFIHMDQHPLVEYYGHLLFLRLSSFTNWPALITNLSLETVAFGIGAFGLYQWTWEAFLGTNQ